MVFVANLHEEAAAEDVAALFKRFGEVLKLTFKKPKNEASKTKLCIMELETEERVNAKPAAAAAAAAAVAAAGVLLLLLLCVFCCCWCFAVAAVGGGALVVLLVLLLLLLLDWSEYNNNYCCFCCCCCCCMQALSAVMHLHNYEFMGRSLKVAFSKSVI